jgi:hypothetical protein
VKNETYGNFIFQELIEKLARGTLKNETNFKDLNKFFDGTY